MFPDEQEKSTKSQHCDTPYPMTTSSFDKFVKQNTREFHQEYERCMDDSKKNSQIIQNSSRNKSEKMKIDRLPKTCNKNESLTVKRTLPTLSNITETCNENKSLTVRQTIPTLSNITERCNENKLLSLRQTPSMVTQSKDNRHKQLGQISHTDCLPTTSTNLTSSAAENMEISKGYNFHRQFLGYCFSFLMDSKCKHTYLNGKCTFKHNVSIFIYFLF